MSDKIIKAYRTIKRVMRQASVLRLTQRAESVQERYQKLMQTDRKYAEIRKINTIEIEKRFNDKQYHNPFTLAECVKCKPEKLTTDQITTKINAISDSIDSLKKEYRSTTNTTQKQAITQKIYRLQARKAELKFNSHKHKEYDKIEYTWDMLKNDVLTNEGDNITNLAKIITFCSCKKSIDHEGTKTQCQMFYACCRAEWDQQDVYDVLSVARLSMIECLTLGADRIKKYIYFLEKSVDMLKHLNPVIDTDETRKIVQCFKKHCPCITDDYKTNRRLVNRYKWVLQSIKNQSIDNMIHSVFLAINNYLVSIRAIHVSDNFYISSLESDYEYYCNIPENETRIDLLFNDSDKKEKRQAILSAYHKLSDILTKSELTTLKYLIKGYTVSQIAYKRKITKQCINNHLCNIRSVFSRFIVSDPLQYAVIADCIIIDSDSNRQPKTDSTNTAEKKTDRQLEIDRIKNSMTEGLKAGIKEQIIKSLNDFNLKVYYSLLDGTIRQTAETLNKSKTTIGRIQTAIIKSVFDTIDYECNITVNRDLFKKITLSELMHIFD